MSEAFDLLEWDTGFFGFKVARLLIPACGIFHLESALMELRKRQVSLVYLNVDSARPDLCATARRCGATAVGVKLTYSRARAPFDAGRIPSQPVVREYPLRETSRELDRLALEAGTRSRFRVDVRFPRTAFEALYREWIRRCVLRELADVVLVTQGTSDSLGGFITVGLSKAVTRTGSIGLLAVAEPCRGNGHGRALVSAAVQYCESLDCSVTEVITQATNHEACRLYETCGFALAKREHQFHFWLGEPPDSHNA